MPPTVGKATERDKEFLIAVYQSLVDPNPKIDWAKAADLAGFANAKSASSNWGLSKKRILAYDFKSNDTGKEGGTKRGRPKKASPAAEDNVGSDDDDAEDASQSAPKAAPKAPKKRNRSVKGEAGGNKRVKKEEERVKKEEERVKVIKEEDEDEEEEEENVEDVKGEDNE